MGSVGPVILAGLVGYGSMLVAAVLGDLPLLTPSNGLRLPFLRDLNVPFMFLVSFPVMFRLATTDDRTLNAALRSVQNDGVLVVGDGAFDELAKWTHRFRTLNIGSTVIGIALGLAVAYGNYVTYSRPEVGYWMTGGSGQLQPVGRVYLVWVGIFYAMVAVYTLRSLAILAFLKDLVRSSSLQMLPAHPDRCGGLRPVGEIGLRNQYALSALGLNLIILIGVSYAYLDVPTSLVGLISVAAVAYLVLGPLSFVGPLLPFRDAMRRTKTTLLGKVARRLRRELMRLRDELDQGTVTQDDLDLIERLRKVGGIIDELPVWPFDWGTLRRFLTAYVVPVASALGFPAFVDVVRRVLESFGTVL